MDDVDAGALKDLARRLTDLLKLKTLPVGLKMFENAAGLDAIAGLRRPPAGQVFSTCQLLTQARIAGLTLGIVSDNLLPNATCGAVLGLSTLTEDRRSGQQKTGIWFDNQEAAAAHQAGMPTIPHGKYQALAISPLRSGRLDPPDIVFFAANPAQMILLFNGLQRRTYRRYRFEITGECSCADLLAHAVTTREVSLSLPCYAERRFGGIADDELLISMPPADLVNAVEGLEGLAKVGLRYPILPYGTNVDFRQGLTHNYGGKGG
jgi:uncharacterized protein (DUF169 family)